MVIEVIKRGQVMGYEGDKLVYKYPVKEEEVPQDEVAESGDE